MAVTDQTIKFVGDSSNPLYISNGTRYRTYPISAPADRFLDSISEASKVISMQYLPNVAGSDGSAVTAVLKKAPVGTAAASGTSLHASGSFDLKGTAGTIQNATLATSDATLTFAAGDRLALDVTGTTTAVDGLIIVGFRAI